MTLGGVQLQHPGGYSNRYCQLEEDGGGVRGFGGFVEIVRLPHGQRAARRHARGGAPRCLDDCTTSRFATLAVVISTMY
jgi:hypothetical protein